MHLLRRVDGDPRSSDLYIVAIVVLIVIIVVIVAFFVLRHLRKQNCQPKLIPGKFLKGVWQRWQPSSLTSSVTYNAVPGGTAQLANANGSGSNQTSREGAVDRNTSVRSVMTLPSYTITPKASERVIAREGERAGMDIVVEFPETAEEEEANRDEQMESLYQIRLTRRREIAEREELRQQRREARERGDWARAEELRRESRARAEAIRLQSPNGSGASVSAAALLAEHQSRVRDRRVSSVSYADIGHVRHDGTRLFSGSPDSDSRTLLSAAAGMDGGHAHQRRTSASSLLSHASNNSDAESVGSDLGGQSIPPPYDGLAWGDAPPYRQVVHEPEEEVREASVEERANGAIRDDSHSPRLPSLSTLPSIAIEVATPTNSAPPTPISNAPNPAPERR